MSKQSADRTRIKAKQHPERSLQRLRVLFLQRNYGLLALDVLVDGLGGGFAGTIQAFVPVDLLDAYKAAIDGCFGEGSCHVLDIRNYGAVPVTPDM